MNTGYIDFVFFHGGRQRGTRKTRICHGAHWNLVCACITYGSAFFTLFGQLLQLACSLCIFGRPVVFACGGDLGLYPIHARSFSLGKRISVQDGDVIIAVAGVPVEKVGSVGSEIIMNEAKSITVLRAGESIELSLPEGFIKQLNENRLGGCR